jgi:hypothetical protein
MDFLNQSIKQLAFALDRSRKMKVTIMTSLFAKRNMDVNACHCI